jgi:two-component system, NarL family, nitrate/nitrite response regulator NarL
MFANQSSKKVESGKHLKNGIRILLVDDHTLFREGLKILLEELDDFFVVAETADGREVTRLVRDYRPDLLIIDLQVSEFSGMEVLKQVKVSTGNPNLRKILLTSSINEEQIEEALLLGVKGILLKNVASITLFQCITCVLNDQYWIGQKPISPLTPLPRDNSILIEKGSHIRDFGLTARELEILVKVLEGKTNRELASQFSISQNTVKRHLTNIFDKLGVYNRLELALFTIHHEVIQPS